MVLDLQPGTFIGASVFLHQLTGDEKYLNNAVLAADYTMEYMYKNGIMNNEADGDDMPGFKGFWHGGSSKLVVMRKPDEIFCGWMKCGQRMAAP